MAPVVVGQSQPRPARNAGGNGMDAFATRTRQAGGPLPTKYKVQSINNMKAGPFQQAERTAQEAHGSIERLRLPAAAENRSGQPDQRRQRGCGGERGSEQLACAAHRRPRRPRARRPHPLRASCCAWLQTNPARGRVARGLGTQGQGLPVRSAWVSRAARRSGWSSGLAPSAESEPAASCGGREGRAGRGAADRARQEVFGGV